MPSMKNPAAASIPLLSLLLFFFTTCATAQAPAAAPAPAGPANITGILAKDGNFDTFIRLLKSTQVASQMDNQLNDSSNGMTLFAPTDNAWSALPAGTLNKLNNQQKVELVQFHVLPDLVTMTQFDTETNPLRTQAGDSMPYQFPLNVTAEGSQVNISTGVVNATVASTVYSDDQLAVYEVNEVLLPMALFGAPAPAQAPSPAEAAKKKKKKSTAEAPGAAGDDAADTKSAGGRVLGRDAIAGSVVVAITVILASLI